MSYISTKIDEVRKACQLAPYDKRPSEFTVANTLRKILQEKFGDGNVIITLGMLWYYNPEDGLWRYIEKDDLKSCVLNFPHSGSSIRAEHVLDCFLIDPQLLDRTFFDTTTKGTAFKNVVLSASREGLKLEQSNQNHRLRVGLTHSYDPIQKPTSWLKFLNELFVTDDDRYEKIQLIQEFIGICLCGEATKYQKCLVLLGGGANGKSVLINAIRHLFPLNSISEVSPHDWRGQYDRMYMNGKLLNSVAELPAQATISSDKFKAIITGDALTCRNPYGNVTQMRPTAGHIFATNELPPVSDHTDGFWRRLMMLEFNQTFVAGKNSRNQDEILRELEPEIPAIAAWALEGAARLMKRDYYVPPESHFKCINKWRTEADNVAAWAKEHITNHPVPEGESKREWLKKNGFKPAGLFSYYKKWVDSNGFKGCTLTTFGTRMGRLGYLKVHTMDGDYYAVRFNNPSLDPSYPMRGCENDGGDLLEFKPSSHAKPSDFIEE